MIAGGAGHPENELDVMSWGYNDWRPYVPVAQRRANATRQMAKMMKKTGRSASPVVLESRKIATTFWGKAWCDNLEAYSDYANRLPRGRTYLRNGSVVDLQISEGEITSHVSGSELYKIEIKVQPLAPKVWMAIQKECAGKIDSLIDLLQGKLSTGVMQVVTRQNGGLFPTPKEIALDCSCPDWADLCKHVAATLYGVGTRLDQKPELLFVLRGVDSADLISRVSATEAVRTTSIAPVGATIADNELADVFGIDLDTSASASPPPAKPAPLAGTTSLKRARGRPRKTPPPTPARAKQFHRRKKASASETS